MQRGSLIKEILSEWLPTDVCAIVEAYAMSYSFVTDNRIFRSYAAAHQHVHDYILQDYPWSYPFGNDPEKAEWFQDIILRKPAMHDINQFDEDNNLVHSWYYSLTSGTFRPVDD